MINRVTFNFLILPVAVGVEIVASLVFGLCRIIEEKFLTLLQLQMSIVWNQNVIVVALIPVRGLHYKFDRSVRNGVSLHCVSYAQPAFCEIQREANKIKKLQLRKKIVFV